MVDGQILEYEFTVDEPTLVNGRNDLPERHPGRGPERADEAEARLRDLAAKMREEKGQDIAPKEPVAQVSEQKVETSQAAKLAVVAEITAAENKASDYQVLMKEKGDIEKEIKDLDKLQAYHERVKNAENPPVMDRLTKWLTAAKVKPIDEDHDLHINHATERLPKLKEKLAKIEEQLGKHY